jgi:hypothetical protein
MFLLVLGVLGAVFLGTDRVTQRRSADKDAAARVEADELLDLRRHAADAYRDSADDRNAQNDAQHQADAEAANASAQAQRAASAGRGGTTASRSDPRSFGPIPASCSEFTGNVAIGCAILPEFGFGIDQMVCLKPLWMKESGWNPKSKNPSSGAYGIPQASPASKMSVYGSDYLTNPATQIRWGLSYIKNRYQTPCGAWSFWQAHHWY